MAHVCSLPCLSLSVGASTSSSTCSLRRKIPLLVVERERPSYGQSTDPCVVTEAEGSPLLPVAMTTTPKQLLFLELLFLSLEISAGANRLQSVF